MPSLRRAECAYHKVVEVRVAQREGAYCVVSVFVEQYVNINPVATVYVNRLVQALGVGTVAHRILYMIEHIVKVEVFGHFKIVLVRRSHEQGLGFVGCEVEKELCRILVEFLEMLENIFAFLVVGISHGCLCFVCFRWQS